MVRCASGGNNDRDDHQAQEAQNLDGSSDDLSFAKEADVHQVDE